ncbi:HD domain-containing protein [Candidatus Microgenomates bacterium]|nr:HD domain-containing protein [Candidatus Microgenomates bacterium]
MKKDLEIIRKEITEKIKTSKLCDPWFYEEHFLVVEKFAKELFCLYPDVNKQAVMLAVWFHDVSRAWGKSKDHDFHSAEYAKKVLTQKGFDKKLIDLVYEVCRSHSCKKYQPQSIEAKILTTADAMSHFSGGFYLRLIHKWGKTMEYAAAKKRLLKKIKRDYQEKILLQEAKKATKSLYQAWQMVIKEINLKK